jgi:uncharacterized membrane protein YfcA
MSTQLDAIRAGQEAAGMLFEALKAADDERTDDDERLFWWAGFFGALGGFAAGSLGTGALTAIAEMTGKTTKQVLDKVSH